MAAPNVYPCFIILQYLLADNSGGHKSMLEWLLPHQEILDPTLRIFMPALNCAQHFISIQLNQNKSFLNTNMGLSLRQFLFPTKIFCPLQILPFNVIEMFYLCIKLNCTAKCFTVIGRFSTFHLKKISKEFYFAAL